MSLWILMSIPVSPSGCNVRPDVLNWFRLCDRLCNLKEPFVCWIKVCMCLAGIKVSVVVCQVNCAVSCPQVDCKPLRSSSLVFSWFSFSWAWMSVVIEELCHDNLDYEFKTKMFRRALLSWEIPSVIIIYHMICTYWLLKSYITRRLELLHHCKLNILGFFRLLAGPNKTFGDFFCIYIRTELGPSHCFTSPK